MAHSARSLRLIGASVVALLLVGGAYVASGPIPFFSTSIVGAQSSAELLREYAVKDSDSDGLPDWQEALYGTDPYVAQSFQPGINDGEAVAQGLIQPKVAVAPGPDPIDVSRIPGKSTAPNSITDRFAQALFKQYISTRGQAAPDTEEIALFVEEGVVELTKTSATPDKYAASSVKVSALTGAAALRAYAAQTEAVFAEHTVAADKNELSYFADAVRDDKAALAKISEISGAYKNIANGLMQLSVPPEAKLAHLRIANSLVHMSEVSADMASMESDPLRALLGIGLYSNYAESMAAAFSALNNVFASAGVSLTEGEPGYYVFKAARDGASIQNNN
ncbi:thrombospondin type 3 repeat-containing protein [Patescibacteria group bacterium]|nr:thrombospondin type 3 repeat-containing protein [Patescibacteria group bacterium]MBU1500631.1 thrombospondin type 3 repeat-containing protein [Patescibacteria group bacterium]MBU2080526.1 thrombospondin type 3 repeat-containing protein [Patescibacteria group bacterium]MBU2123669.1 thrombospondin type 3 repeat-containing protein [Patescibacteria group bacterium]MBU2194525.1 thrombospondin type 3 repeat-containing protein [Patescibacteria group bacterium]